MRRKLQYLSRLSGLVTIVLAIIAITLAVSLFLADRSPSYAQVPANAPIGSIVAWSGPTNKIPPNWLVCDGRELNRTGEFVGLFNAIGTTWGGTATDKFKIPDLRGLFLRGVDGGTNRDPDASGRTPSGTAPTTDAGSTQGDAFAKHNHNPVTTTISPNPHNHSYREPGGGGSSEAPGHQGLQGATTGDVTLSATTTMTDAGGSETRPKNAYVYWIIRAK